MSDDKHVIVNGGRWHWPKQGEPEKCGVPGCDRVMGQDPS